MTPRFALTTFGEGGLRLGVGAGHQIQTTSKFDVHMAGTEANVACTLARLGWPTSWMSCVADDPIGERVLHPLRGAGVDLTGVIRKSTVRTGVYFIEHAHAPRPTRVFYDRKNTGTALLTTSEVNWSHLLDTRITHHTGITGGISNSALAIVGTALQRARAAGVTTSFDVNHRHLLWTPQAAREALRPLLASVDILFCSLRDARTVFGIDADPTEAVGQLSQSTGAKHVVVSNGGEGVTGLCPAGVFTVPARPTTIVDRAGAGDALVSGVLHGILCGDFAAGLKYGQLLAAMAMSQHGERVITTRTELELFVDRGGADIDR